MKFWAQTLFLASMLMVAQIGQACEITYEVQLETFGEGVLVELRTGRPGASTVLKSQRSNGETVRFTGLCPATYFLAIGNDDSVNVTQTRFFADGSTYTSRITIKRGSGNVSRQSRKSL
jgi:hypothetical protein